MLKRKMCEDNFMSGTNLYHYNGGQNLLSEIKDCNQQRININEFLNRQIKNPYLNILIGSGASVGAIPLMGDTIKKILADEENSDIKSEFIVFSDFQDDDKNVFEKFLINDCLTNSDKEISKKYANFSDIEGFMTYLQQKINVSGTADVKTKLTKIFTKLKQQFIASIPRLDDEKYNSSETTTLYSNFYQQIFYHRQNSSPKLNVFTTNYDLFNELAFEKIGINYSTGFRNGLKPTFDITQFNYRQVDERNRYKDKWQPTTKEADLYKLHGSINWIEYDNSIVQSNSSEETNVVIYPTVLKHVETARIPYSPLFRELSIELQKPNSTLLIIGYGFGDDHINNIIFQNISNQDFTLIIFGDISEEKLKEIKETCKNTNLHIIGGDVNTTKAHYFNNVVNHLLTANDNEDEKAEHHNA
ncbi:hypothetical protein EFN55_04335 [Leuconostoc citreum]|nr:hypothetical protein [Leuconostoc citreum]